MLERLVNQLLPMKLSTEYLLPPVLRKPMFMYTDKDSVYRLVYGEWEYPLLPLDIASRLDFSNNYGEEFIRGMLFESITNIVFNEYLSSFASSLDVERIYGTQYDIFTSNKNYMLKGTIHNSLALYRFVKKSSRVSSSDMVDKGFPDLANDFMPAQSNTGNCKNWVRELLDDDVSAEIVDYFNDTLGDTTGKIPPLNAVFNTCRSFIADYINSHMSSILNKKRKTPVQIAELDSLYLIHPRRLFIIEAKSGDVDLNIEKLVNNVFKPLNKLFPKHHLYYIISAPVEKLANKDGFLNRKTKQYYNALLQTDAVPLILPINISYEVLVNFSSYVLNHLIYRKRVSG